MQFFGYVARSFVLVTLCCLHASTRALLFGPSLLVKQPSMQPSVDRPVLQLCRVPGGPVGWFKISTFNSGSCPFRLFVGFKLNHIFPKWGMPNLIGGKATSPPLAASSMGETGPTSNPWGNQQPPAGLEGTLGRQKGSAQAGTPQTCGASCSCLCASGLVDAM